MSIFETLLDTVQNQNADGAPPAATGGNMMTTILGLVNSPELGGNLSGLIEKFSQGGLSEQVASWVGTGANLPINGEQLQSVLGSSFVQSFAEKLGINTEDAAGSLAAMLPQVVDKLTPDGEVSNDGNLAEMGMSMLSGLLGNKSA